MCAYILIYICNAVLLCSCGLSMLSLGMIHDDALFASSIDAAASGFLVADMGDASIPANQRPRRSPEYANQR